MKRKAVGEIGAAGGIVEVTDPSSLIYRAGIEIPLQTLNEVELITISLMATPAALPADGCFAAGECVHFGPEGLLFGSNVNLYLPYFDDNGDGLLDGTNSIELEIGVKHFNRSTGNWETVEVVNRQADANLTNVASNHLSLYMPYGNYNDLPLQADQVNILTWMTADRDTYPGGTAFGCSGVAILSDDLIFKTYAVEPLPAEKETAYFGLMTDPKIDAATKLTEEEQEILVNFIRQLEYQATCDWEDLHRPEVSSLSIEELKLVWLRRLAVAFYHEVNDRFLWKIADYSQNDLDVLLGFNFLNGNPSFLDPANSGGDFTNIAPDRYYFRNVVWSATPLHAMVIMHIVCDLYNSPTP